MKVVERICKMKKYIDYNFENAKQRFETAITTINITKTVIVD